MLGSCRGRLNGGQCIALRQQRLRPPRFRSVCPQHLHATICSRRVDHRLFGEPTVNVDACSSNEQSQCSRRAITADCYGPCPSHLCQPPWQSGIAPSTIDFSPWAARWKRVPPHASLASTDAPPSSRSFTITSWLPQTALCCAFLISAPAPTSAHSPAARSSGALSNATHSFVVSTSERRSRGLSCIPRSDSRQSRFTIKPVVRASLFSAANTEAKLLPLTEQVRTSALNRQGHGCIEERNDEDSLRSGQKAGVLMCVVILGSGKRRQGRRDGTVEMRGCWALCLECSGRGVTGFIYRVPPAVDTQRMKRWRSDSNFSGPCVSARTTWG